MWHRLAHTHTHTTIKDNTTLDCLVRLALTVRRTGLMGWTLRPPNVPCCRQLNVPLLSPAERAPPSPAERTQLSPSWTYPMPPSWTWHGCHHQLNTPSCSQLNVPPLSRPAERACLTSRHLLLLVLVVIKLLPPQSFSVVPENYKTLSKLQLRRRRHADKTHPIFPSETRWWFRELLLSASCSHGEGGGGAPCHCHSQLLLTV